MTSLILGLYGLFLIVVGARGNAPALFEYAAEDAPNYFPWLLAIIGIAFLSEFESTRPAVKPFIVLVALNFFLSNFSTIEAEIKKMSDSTL